MAKVLVVEDNKMFREALKEALIFSFPSLELEEVEDSEGVMEKVRHHPPDVVLMDIQLPQENGLALTRRIKALREDLPVIIMTSYDTPDYRQNAFQAGADHFLSKKYLKPSDIVRVVRSFLHGNEEPG